MTLVALAVSCCFRVCRSLAVLAGVSVLAFAAVSLAPGDFLSDAALASHASPQTIRVWRDRFGLDRSWPERYARWASSVARGEGGYSLAYQVPVASLLKRRAPVTLLLGGVALAVSWSAALLLGVWSAARHRHWDGRAIALGATALMGVPDLLVALAILLAAARGGWLPALPIAGAESAGGWIDDAVSRLPLPVAALTLTLTPGLLRHVRAAVLDVLGAPYLAAQRARGVPPRRLLWRAALRAAANPLISLFGLSLAAVFSASMIVEVILSWPGLGPLFLDAVQARDPHVVLAGVMCAAALLVFGTAASDGALRLADPRIREDAA